MSNVKVSYVNFYGHATTYNTGERVPLMLRIGGSILASEYNGASVKLITLNLKIILDFISIF